MKRLKKCNDAASSSIILGPASFGFFNSMKAGRSMMIMKVKTARKNGIIDARAEVEIILLSFRYFCMVHNITVSIPSMQSLFPVNNAFPTKL